MKTVFLMYIVFGIAVMNQIIAADQELVRDIYRPRPAARPTSTVDQNNNSSREPNRNTVSTSRK